MNFVTWFLKLERLPGHILEKLGQFDWPVATLLSVSSAGFLFGNTTGGAIFAWPYQVLMRLPIALGGIMAFIYLEFRFATEPVLEKRMFATFKATDVTLVVEVIKEMNDSSSSRSLMIYAYSESVGTNWTMLLMFSATGVMLSFTVKAYSMSQEHVAK
ncbi:Efflux pump FUS6 [Apiospora rasikravindrae]|uniref:Efflux pump FUS6 n=1 Tax=Apiospora rasikravindrae TaxID=990691 RepID=A0ABR1TEY3_9PEZI